MRHDGDLLVVLEPIVLQELPAHLLDDLCALVQEILSLEGAVGKLLAEELKHRSVDVGEGSPAFSATQILKYLLFLNWIDDSVDIPELRLGQSSDFREVKVETTASGLSWGVPLHQLEDIHVHILSRRVDRADHWLDNKTDVHQVRVSLEHVNRCFHGAYQRRDPDVLEVQLFQ